MKTPIKTPIKSGLVLLGSTVVASSAATTVRLAFSTPRQRVWRHFHFRGWILVTAVLFSVPVMSQVNYSTPYIITTLAGQAGSQGSADGTGNAARFHFPLGVAVDSTGNVYVPDQGNHTIRQVTPMGVVTTLAGSAGSPGSADGKGSTARFNSPSGVALDSAGNIYVADRNNETIRKITPAGIVTTLAGLAGVDGSADGTGAAARFSYPYSVAVDSATNIYVGDAANYTVRKVTPLGVVTTLAGLAGSFGSADGTGSAARFSFTQGVAVDGAGNVYVGDSANSTIRRITPGGVVTTLAGLAGNCGNVDGVGSAARFCEPFGVAVDSAGNVYVADADNGLIRKVTSAGVVTTLAGGWQGSVGSDGQGRAAQFNFPAGVAVDSARNLYVGDTENHTIRKGTPALIFDTDYLTVSNGLFQVRLVGPSGSNVVVEASADLQTWTLAQTNSLPPDGLDVSALMGTNKLQFYRGRLN
jgi:hypothetical protein